MSLQLHAESTGCSKLCCTFAFISSSGLSKCVSIAKIPQARPWRPRYAIARGDYDVRLDIAFVRSLLCACPHFAPAAVELIQGLHDVDDLFTRQTVNDVFAFPLCGDKAFLAQHGQLLREGGLTDT